MRPAFVTGGSSGIGLAAALLLAKKGHDIALFARDTAKLANARRSILAAAPQITVCEFPVDVSDRNAITSAVEEAASKLGCPRIAMASAGVAYPGLFTEQPLEHHERQMAVNYFGTLYFTHAVTKLMSKANGGQIGLISSGAAFVGIYGYAAYAPSKFALRGLAEVLRLELEAQNISITVCYPPDTKTPQLEVENATKPAATAEFTQGGGLWNAEAVALKLIEGMAKGRLVVTPGPQMLGLSWFGSLIAPVLRSYQRRLIRKHSS